MRKLIVGTLCLGSLMFSGCVVAPFEPPMGMISSVKAPLSIDHDRTAVTTKKGESSASCVLCLFSFGDASTQSAARDGDLKVIHYLDYEYLNIIGLYQKTTVIAHGE